MWPRHEVLRPCHPVTSAEARESSGDGLVHTSDTRTQACDGAGQPTTITGTAHHTLATLGFDGDGRRRSPTGRRPHMATTKRPSARKSDEPSTAQFLRAKPSRWPALGGLQHVVGYDPDSSAGRSPAAPFPRTLSMTV